MVARVQGEPSLARQALLDRLTKIDPNMGTIITMRSVAGTETFFLQTALLGVAHARRARLVADCSGLFSVLSYLVEQRTAEIGLRMALGASPRAVTHWVLGQMTRPVMAGLIAGAALAAALATAVLATPFGGLISQIVHVTDPVAYVASLAVIVSVCLLAAWIPAARAAKVDPMRTLRQDINRYRPSVSPHPVSPGSTARREPHRDGSDRCSVDASARNRPTDRNQGDAVGGVFCSPR